MRLWDSRRRRRALSSVMSSSVKTRRKHPEPLRLVEALVERDGQSRPMVFLSNNTDWAPSSICALYGSRWGIEVFFENAVRWQIWTALLVYVLVRFVAWQSRWKHSFTRLFTLLRGVVWSNVALSSVLARCGTAPGRARARAAPAQLLLPGLGLGSKMREGYSPEQPLLSVETGQNGPVFQVVGR